MTRWDVMRLDIGDSLIGLNGEWRDELPVIDVGELHIVNHDAMRHVSVQSGIRVAQCLVREGDEVIRSARVA